jgi:hypothetical protein
VPIGYAVSPTRLRVAVGTPGGDGPETFVYEQIAASTQWNVAHELNRFPSVTTVDSAGNLFEADVLYLDANNIQINLTQAISGWVYLN